MAFADNLRQLPPVTHLAALELLDDAGQVIAQIPNQPGKAGSLAVYAALAAKHGSITVAAAEEGLALFAEHTEAARQHPGSHPNIDGLLGPVHTIFARCVAIKKGQAQGAKRSWGATPARLGNAANGPF